MRGTVCAVVGAQYGSEGKGVIVSDMANDYNVHVRTGGPNAGHTHYFEGKEYKQQSVPVGWTNPDAICVIGRGALVSRDQLIREVEEIRKTDASILGRLSIDADALWLHEKFRKQEDGVRGELHQLIGSTGEGVGACRAARMARNPNDIVPRVKDMARHWPSNLDWHIADVLCDTRAQLNAMFEGGSRILLEGTQGFGLSLIHGNWPYVTSHDTTAATLAADCGLSPRWVKEIVLVARTFPIRVAGNSGPLRGEITWADMSRRIGKQVEEFTTVTNKSRRLGHWDEELFMAACAVNGPTAIALTFIDYLSPEDTGKSKVCDQTRKFIEYVETISGAPVSWICTGKDDSGSMKITRR